MMNESAAAIALRIAQDGAFQEAIASLAELRREIGHDAFLRAVAKAINARWPDSSGDATELFESASLAAEDSGTAMYNLGAGLWALDEIPAALAAFQLGADEGSRDSTLALGTAALWVGDESRGLDALSSLLGSTDQIGALAAAALGRYEVQTDRVTPETVALLERGVEVDQDFVPELADAYLKLGRLDAAITLLSEQSVSGNPVAPIVLGNLYEERVGNDELAEKAFRRGIELHDAYSAYNLAALLDRLGRPSESRKYLKLAARMGDERAMERLSKS